jgi:hypothetical protein
MKRLNLPHIRSLLGIFAFWPTDMDMDMAESVFFVDKGGVRFK